MGGTDTMRDRALHLASLGFKVFRLRSNEKLPAVENFFALATSDAEKVRAMWTEAVTGESTTHNIGVLAGAADAQLLIVDVDGAGHAEGKRGFESLAALVREKNLDTNTLTALTPSGGRHLYYRIPATREISGHANRLGDGLDVRGYHQYVAGVGSITPQGEYDWYEADASILDAPEWLIDLCQRAEKKLDNTFTPIDLDIERNIASARNWLLNMAGEAIAGQGGNEATFKIACRVKDFGLSREAAADAMLVSWNDTKAVPPWPADELIRIVENAYRYGQAPAGATAAEAEFDEVTLAPAQEKPLWPQPTPLQRFDIDGIPLRRFIVQDFLARSFVSGLVSPPGAGKTSLIAATLIACASGKREPIGQDIVERVPCWYWNQEDDKHELQRRLGAVMRRFDIQWSDLEHESRPMLYIDSGVDNPLTLVKKVENGLAINKAVKDIIAQIKERNIGLFIIDPLSEFHEAEENSNPDMRIVWGVARRIAVEAGCAVLIAAHSRKLPQASSDGYAGDIDGLRGASSQSGVMRLGYTMYSASTKDCKDWGIPEAEKHLYVRMDSAKSNLSLLGDKPRWMKRIGVMLGREGARESIGVLEPAMLEERKPEMDLCHLIAKTLAAGGRLGRGKAYSFGAIVECLSDAEKAVLGSDKSNYARAVKKALTAHGWDENKQTKPGTGVPQFSTQTEYGMLSVFIKIGRDGITFRLAEEAISSTDELVTTLGQPTEDVDIFA